MESQGSLLRRLVPSIPMPVRAAEAEAIVTELFELAGVTIGGTAVGDIRVRDPRFYERLLRDHSLGFGEAYMDEWWESDAVDVTIDKLLSPTSSRRSAAAGACVRWRSRL